MSANTDENILTDQLRRWYLARLRKRALADAEHATTFTPATLILADKQRLEELITNNPLKRAARLDPPSNFIDPALCRAFFGLLLLIQTIVCVLLYSQSKDIFLSLALLFVLWFCTGICLAANLQQEKRITSIGSFLKMMDSSTKDASETWPEHLLTDLRAQWSSLEDHQNLIADYSSDVICTLDNSLRITCVAPSSFQAWGIKPEQLTGRLLSEILVNKDESFLLPLFSAAQGKLTEFVFQAQLIGSNTLIDTEWSVEWSSSAKLFFAVVKDITAESEIDRIKNEVIAIVSHDLRSPITNIQWILKALRDGMYGDINDIGKKRLNGAEHTVEFLLDIIADLLDLHRIEIGKPQLVYETVQLGLLLDDSILALHELAESKNIRLMAKAADGSCEVDKARIKRVLINLISNAIKFSPKATTITVEARVSEAEVTFLVSDQGKGIPPEFVDKLFDRFCNVGNPTARREGSGLGLFASKAIIEAHGGSISVASSEATGTTFTIQVPMKHQKSPEAGGTTSIS